MILSLEVYVGCLKKCMNKWKAVDNDLGWPMVKEDLQIDDDNLRLLTFFNRIILSYLLESLLSKFKC